MTGKVLGVKAKVGAVVGHGPAVYLKHKWSTPGPVVKVWREGNESFDFCVVATIVCNALVARGFTPGEPGVVMRERERVCFWRCFTKRVQRNGIKFPRASGAALYKGNLSSAVRCVPCESQIAVSSRQNDSHRVIKPG
ncbi:MAG: hypothetical protein DDT37_01785 [Firmicutes bacterium]|nr:hypothetical protein [candidate division NPL-UPA2 bacterium]